MCGVWHGQLARAAGTSCTLIKKDRDTGYATLRLQSGEVRLVRLACMATVGVVSNKVRPPQPLASFFVAPSPLGHRFALLRVHRGHNGTSCIQNGARRASPYPLSPHERQKFPVVRRVCGSGMVRLFDDGFREKIK